MNWTSTKLIVFCSFLALMYLPSECHGQIEKRKQIQEYQIYSRNDASAPLPEDKIHGNLIIQGDTIYELFQNSKLIETGPIVITEEDNLDLKVTVHKVVFKYQGNKNRLVNKYIPDSSLVYGYRTNDVLFVDENHQPNTAYRLKKNNK